MTSSPAPSAASQYPLAARLDQQRLGRDTGELLEDQRRVAEEPAGVAPAGIAAAAPSSRSGAP